MSEDGARTAEFSPAKRRQILAGARATFGELGFERACVDVIASRAGVSKATVYNHFGDKKGLFVACFSEEVDALRDGVRASLAEPAGDLEQALLETGEKVVALLLSPAVVALYRHAQAESVRFPEIGQTLFDHGPNSLQAQIASYLQRWHEKGALSIDDPRTAAVQFVSLCQSDLVLRARLGILERPADARIRETVRSAVRTFLRAFGR
ncbi:TetR/AcrR family transcriptional regulator [Anaeromyxobacter terrae]|uniref:TetR/AcrR family transcriptional regulator n=1 Tax=Anaeromyxobacter terrae TaxID=2925406 RepID=UPI001F56E52C|nr:TetR/AcrR family transcriptional regulator [Anaeromyxobacter sp. SG22]